ncbi:hypothetical protein ACQ4LE_002450 [Meloidogyne hapla]
MEEEQQPDLPLSDASSSSSIGDPENPPPYNAPLTLDELITHLENFKGSPVTTLASGIRRQLIIYNRNHAEANQLPYLQLRVDEAVRHCEDAERHRVNNLPLQPGGRRSPPRVADREGRRIYFTAAFDNGTSSTVKWSPGPAVQN